MGPGDNSTFHFPPTGAAGCLAKGSTQPLHIKSCRTDVEAFNPSPCVPWWFFRISADQPAGLLMTQNPGPWKIKAGDNFVCKNCCLRGIGSSQSESVEVHDVQDVYDEHWLLPVHEASPESLGSSLAG